MFSLCLNGAFIVLIFFTDPGEIALISLKLMVLNCGTRSFIGYENVDGDSKGDGETDWQSTDPSLRTVPKSTWSFTSISSFEPITCNQQQVYTKWHESRKSSNSWNCNLWRKKLLGTSSIQSTHSLARSGLNLACDWKNGIRRRSGLSELFRLFAAIPMISWCPVFCVLVSYIVSKFKTKLLLQHLHWNISRTGRTGPIRKATSDTGCFLEQHDIGRCKPGWKVKLVINTWTAE